MLITSILAALGGSSSSSSSRYILAALGGTTRSSSSSSRPHPAMLPNSSSGKGAAEGPDVLSPGEGWALLLQCEAVKEAHWALRLYLAR